LKPPCRSAVIDSPHLEPKVGGKGEEGTPKKSCKAATNNSGSDTAIFKGGHSGIVPAVGCKSKGNTAEPDALCRLMRADPWADPWSSSEAQDWIRNCTYVTRRRLWRGRSQVLPATCHVTADVAGCKQECSFLHGRGLKPAYCSPTFFATIKMPPDFQTLRLPNDHE